jgi:hypothetical protein
LIFGLKTNHLATLIGRMFADWLTVYFGQFLEIKAELFIPL